MRKIIIILCAFLYFRFYVHPLCLLKKNLGLLLVPGLTRPMTIPGGLVRKLSNGADGNLMTYKYLGDSNASAKVLLRSKKAGPKREFTG